MTLYINSLSAFDDCYASNSYPDLDSFIRERWEGGFLSRWDANDMLTLLKTWQTGDVSLVRDNGDYEKCLGAITAKSLIMPSKTDLYFPVRSYEPLDFNLHSDHLDFSLRIAKSRFRSWVTNLNWL